MVSILVCPIPEKACMQELQVQSPETSIRKRSVASEVRTTDLWHESKSCRVRATHWLQRMTKKDWKVLDCSRTTPAGWPSPLLSYETFEWQPWCREVEVSGSVFAVHQEVPPAHYYCPLLLTAGQHSRLWTHTDSALFIKKKKYLSLIRWGTLWTRLI